MNKWQDPNKGSVPAVALEDYLGELASPVLYQDDKIIGGHKLSQRESERIFKEIETKQAAYFNARQKKIDEYNSKIKSGELRKPTMLEQAIRSAQGHGDLQSVQAARRMAARFGYDWKTGTSLSAI